MTNDKPPASKKGGARKGAGRPKKPEVMMPICARITPHQYAIYKALGGTKWLKQAIDAASTVK